MIPFVRVEGVASPLPLADLDTDQIVPKQFLKTIERRGLARALFFDMRFDESGRERPEFVLNRPGYRDCKVLVTGPNFGCGSSREHAPWALADFGIRCLIGNSFADIFRSNCFENGILPIVLEPQPLATLFAELDHPRLVRVDLPAQTVEFPLGTSVRFMIEPDRKDRLVRGVDAIAATLEYEADIEQFERVTRRDI